MRLQPDVQSGHVLALILGTFLLVTLFMTVIYAVYYDDRHIPRLMAVIRNRRAFRSDVTFARFDNAAQAIATYDSLAEVDLHFGTDQSIENLNSAFNNPMFDQNIPDNDEATRKSVDEVELKAD